MQIVFNGKTYNSFEEMPANERKAFEQMKQIFVDANGNGIPDFMEGDMFRNVMSMASTNGIYQGQPFNNLNDLPPEVREKVQRAMDKLKQMGLVSDVPNIQNPSMNAPASFEPAFQPSKPLIQQEPVIQESGGNRWIVIAMVLAGLVFCGAVAAAVMFMR